ncbi:programmed cell death protein 7-like [Ctenocephalides felis]|uniref:programmed cell death protein 7-like n=1 Tax=Ctenocephalides felis TaxID=7515 RepID=UPI000E6E3060|nr:programmed cell death protein 7-like [Ctenocephalides felis]
MASPNNFNTQVENSVNVKTKSTKINHAKLQKKLQIKESESVLSDVKSRISQARHWLGIIEPLKELRGLRNQAAQARGEKLSLVHHEDFINTMNKLKEIWEAKLAHYVKEEQDLKKSLNIHYEKQFPKTFEEEWKKTLFGENAADFQINSIQEFVAIRSCWDQFIVPPNDAEGSKIPIGYVMPVEPSSDSWKKYLSNDK